MGLAGAQSACFPDLPSVGRTSCEPAALVLAKLRACQPRWPSGLACVVLHLLLQRCSACQRNCPRQVFKPSLLRCCSCAAALGHASYPNPHMCQHCAVIHSYACPPTPPILFAVCGHDREACGAAAAVEVPAVLTWRHLPLPLRKLVLLHYPAPNLPSCPGSTLGPTSSAALACAVAVPAAGLPHMHVWQHRCPRP